MTKSVAKIPDGWKAGYREGYETKEIQVGNCTVRIHSPILNAEEQSQMEKDIEEALKSLGKKGIIS